MGTDKTEKKDRRIKICLVNPTEEEILAGEPLIAFSFYLSGQNNVLLSVSDEIIENLDKGFTNNHTGLIGHASTLMWFWTLGAYEVIRTMCQAKECFSENFYEKISELKKDLEKVRMPSAKMEKKQEKKCKKMPVSSNRSPDGGDIPNKDLLVGDPENPISGRMLLEKYDNVLSSLTIKDIKARHENAYNKESKVDKKDLTEVGNVIIKYFPNQLDLKGESIYGKIYPPCSNRKRRRWLFCNVSGFAGLLFSGEYL